MKAAVENGTPREDIAIVGMACRFPGAVGPEAFWDTLAAGKISTGEIPVSRWDWRLYWGDPQQTPNACNSRWGGFVDGIDAFDREFFGLSQREVEVMDPQQRFALELSWHCMEDAGIRPQTLAGTSTAVFAGVANLDYKEIVEASIPEVDAYYATGAAASVIANRISYFYDLRGPSLTVDTACSSALYALHLARKALLSGDCDAALVGAVSLLLTPRRFLGFAKARMLSPTGMTRTFDDAADGLVRGEGGGFVLLKRLSDAQRDGDRVLGLLSGSALNHGGKTYSLTYPSPQAQARVIDDALRDAGVAPADVTYIEAHGTGTPKGDPIELEGIVRAYGAERERPCRVGSVKANIGHLEAAAGMAGLIKVLMALRHGSIPPQPNFERLNARVDAEALKTAGIEIADRPSEWQTSARGTPRVAGLSGFGFAGTNAHLIVREAPISVPGSVESYAVDVLCLSAKTDAALGRLRSRLADWLEGPGREFTLTDICRALARRRDQFGKRCAVVGGRHAEAAHALREARSVAGALFVSGTLPQDEKGLPVESAVPAEPFRDDPGRFAEEYVQGLPISAWVAYAEGKARHVALPLYPFEPTRCWIPGMAITGPAPSAPANAVLPGDLYLFEEVWIQSDDSSARSALPRTLICLCGDESQAVDLELALKAHAPMCLIHTLVIGENPDAEAHHGLLDALDAKMESNEAPTVVWYCAEIGETQRPDIEGFDRLLHVLKAVAASRLPIERVLLYGLERNPVAQCWPALGRVLEDQGLRSVPVVSVLLDDTTTTERWLPHALAETIDMGRSAVAYRGGVRHAQTLRERDRPGASTGAALRHGGRYLITGGLGGIGRALCMHLMSHYGAEVIAVGRGPLDSARDMQLDALRESARSGKLHYLQADVADPASMHAMADTLSQGGDVLHGVFHAAGVQDDVPLRDKSIAQVHSAMVPKLAAADAMLPLLALAVDFVCHISSVAAYVGDFGAAGYALGNRLLMTLAREAEEGGARHVSIAWPLWEDGTMGFADAAARSRYFSGSGQRALATREAMALLEALLDARIVSVAVAVGERKRIGQWLALAVGSPIALSPASAHETLVEMSAASAALASLEPAALVRACAAAVLKVPEPSLDEEANLADLGLDSIGLMELADALTDRLAQKITPTQLYSHSTLARLAAHIAGMLGNSVQQAPESTVRSIAAPAVDANAVFAGTTLARSRSVDEQSSRSSSCAEGDYPAIAIVGISGRFPGARDVEGFWSILRRGESVVDKVPEGRYPHAWGAGVPPWLAAIPGVDEFDPLFFEISPTEAERMDPRERLLLQETWLALENAGIAEQALRRNRVGMFVGAEAGEYAALDSGARSIVSDHNGILAARMSYFLDLHGPNLSLNTACSSGLVALHQASRSLQLGECDIALAAAINLMLEPALYARMARAGMLSPDGMCRPFDARANGIVPGEAVVAVVLKRLDDAIADGDSIHGIVCASGVNYDGKTNGITAPNGSAQTELIASVHRASGLDPIDLRYIVAHGTGTRLGDPIELNALSDALPPLRDKDSKRWVASNKSNVGHTFAASGLVSLIHLLASMRHDLIPQSAHWSVANEFADWARAPFCINESACSWGVPPEQRMGAVSAFGMSGTNAHVLVRGWVRSAADPVHTDYPQLFLLSAKHPDALRERAKMLADALVGMDAGTSLADVAYTLCVGRMHFAHRAAFVADSREEAIAHLRTLAAAATSANARALADVPVASALARASVARWQDAHVSGHRPAIREALEALARYYRDGAAATVFPDVVRGRTVELPGYPFSRMRYWLERAPSMPAATAKTDLHPLLRGYSPSLDGALFTTMLDGSEPCLRDHRIEGCGVLPGAAYLEIARAAYEATTGRKGPVALEEVHWHDPMRVEGMPVEMRVELTRDGDGDGDGARYRISSALGGSTVLHGSGNVRPATAIARTIDLDAMRRRCADAVDVDALYAGFSDAGIEYGDTHRAIKAFWLGHDAAVARLDGSTMVGGDTATTMSMALPPGVVDSAFQTLFALTRHHGQPLAVPFSIETMTVFSALTTTCWAVIQLRKRLPTGACVADIDIVDDHGHQLATIVGWTSVPWRAPSTLRFRWTWQTRVIGRPALRTRRRLLISPALSTVFGHLQSVDAADQRLLPGVPGVDDTAAYAAQARAVVETLQGMLSTRPMPPTFVQLLCTWDDIGVSALLGLLRTARLEQPAVEIQCLAVPADAAVEEIDRWLAEEQGGDAHVRRRGDLREVLMPEEIAAPATSAPPWRADGIYAVSGGAGGIGLTVARDILGAAPNARVLALGRTSPDDAALATLSDPDRFEFHRVDVGDRSEVDRWLAGLRTRHLSLHGVIHCAGVLDDEVLIRVDTSAIDRVAHPKIAGLIALDEATAGMPLDFFMACASVSGALGNPGQSLYASANAWMDGYLDARAARVKRGERHGVSLSIQWPLWAEGGMRANPAWLATFGARTGLSPLPSPAAMTALRSGIADSEGRMLVLHGDGPRLRAWLRDECGIEPPQPGSAEITGSTPDMAMQSGVFPQAVGAEFDRVDDGMETAAVRERARTKLGALLTGALKLADGQLEADAPFERYGIDSLMIVELNDMLEAQFGKLPKTLFFEYRTLSELAGYFATEHADAFRAPDDGRHEVEPSRARASVSIRAGDVPLADEEDPIVIVGIAGRYPQARSLDDFWRNLAEGRDCITEIPAERWALNGFYDPRKGEPGKSYSRWGGFLDGADEFDPLFFNIAPRDAERMDPQERLFLQCAYTAIEEAGYAPFALGRRENGATRQVGVFAGVMYQEYSYFGVEETLKGNPQALSGGIASVANRVSYHLDLTGPCLAVDTMCSSSLTALHLACHSLRRGECEVALAGGVNLSVHPNKYLMLSDQRFVSSKGRCESFGRGGDGYVPSEGVGVAVLKRLSAALADGDHIHGIVASSAINHGGRNNGYSVPNPARQAQVIETALREAKLRPEDLSYVEAHGTGTSLGDPIEIAGLSRALRSADPDWRCAIGSVKSNIGHAESAAGIAGLTKILLQMKYGQLVPSLHAEVANPNIDFSATPFVVQRELSPWQRPTRRMDGQVRHADRIAGLSSFGAGGSNAHIVVREFRGLTSRADANDTAESPALILISARDGQRLRERIHALCVWLAEGHADALDLRAIAYTLQVGRDPLDVRVGFVVKTVADLRERLERLLRDDAGDDVQRHDLASDRRAGVPIAAPLSAERGDQWMLERRYDRILHAWCLGTSWEWHRWYGEAGAPLGRMPRRISLPMYPFERRRYWVDVTPSSRSGVTTARFPMRALESDDTDVSRFVFSIAADDSLLADHRVDGGRVLPGVAYLALVQEACAALAPDTRAGVVFENVCWHSPCRIGNSDIALMLTLTPESEGHRFVFTGGNAAAPGQRYCSGRIGLRMENIRATIDPVAARSNCSEAWEADACYARFEAFGVVYAGGHRVLDRLWTGSDRAVARLRDARSDDQRGREIGFMDGVLQSLLGLHATDDRISVPFSFERWELSKAPDALRSGAWVIATRRDDARTDIDVCGEDGRVHMRIRGFEARRLPSIPNIDGREADDDRDWALVPSWMPAGEIDPPATANALRTLIVSSDRTRAEAARRGINAIDTVIAGTGADDIASILTTGSHFDRVVFLAPATAAIDADALVSAQQDGVFALFRLFKAFSARGDRQKPLQWTIATEQAIAIAPDEHAYPAHAAIHGLAGVMAREVPAWSIVSVDLERGAISSAHALGRASAPAAGGPWAYRNGRWLARRLTPASMMRASTLPYRRGGVYLVVGGAGGVGSVLSEHLIQQHDAQIVWLGRRAEDRAITAELDRLGGLGRRPFYVQADVVMATALRDAIALIKRRFGAIHGVVHSGLVLDDAPLARMSEEGFARVLAAKLDTSVRLGDAFADEPLDFMLFFSSFASFSHPAGQANYCAGSTFQDAYAHALGARTPYPVKIVNWGFWGNTGIVATATHRERMKRLGVASIEPASAMRAIDALLCGSPSQLAFIRLHNIGPIAEWLTDRDPSSSSDAAVPSHDPTVVASASLRAAREAGGMARNEWEAPLLGLLAHALADVSEERRPRALDRWVRESRRRLAEARIQADQDADALWRRWRTIGEACAGEGAIRAQYALMDAALRGLPDVLSGRRKPTEILFPGGSFALVSGLYTDNPVSDAFNRSLAEALCARAAHPSLAGRPFRILEVGAGTGGTTIRILEEAARCGVVIDEYLFTDISEAFLSEASRRFAAEYPFLRFRLFDVTRDPAAQGIGPAAFDTVVATNVLHATPDIVDTLRNCRRALRDDGVLYVNEVSDASLYTHLTFGLLDGWWRYDDPERRIPGSPLLSPLQWRDAMRAAGFGDIDFPMAQDHGLGLQVIIARHNGAPAAASVAVSPVPASASRPAIAASAGASTRSGNAGILRILAELLGAVLKVEPEAIGPDDAFSDFGLDSILATGWVDAIQRRFDIEIETTVIFEHNSLFRLATYLERHVGSQATMDSAPQDRIPSGSISHESAITPPTASPDRLRSELRSRLSALLKVDIDQIGDHEPFGDYGLDSIIGATFALELGEHYRIALDASAIFEFDTLVKLAGRVQSLIEAAPSPLQSSSMRSTYAPPASATTAAVPPVAAPRHDGSAVFDVAIVGVSCEFPEVGNWERLWERLLAMEDCTRTVDSAWLRGRGGQNPEGDAEAMQSVRGGFLDDVCAFDAEFFGTSAAEAATMDPQQRLLLTHAWRALLDAAVEDEGRGRRVGVFVAAGENEYGRSLDEAGNPFSMTANAPAMLPNRISYALDLHGPSELTDTACSSALVALHRAVQSLRDGECELALVGAVNLLLDQRKFDGFAELGFLSAAGATRSFDASADGFVRSEGVGALVLKPLPAALRDRDRVLGVVKGTAVEHGGRGAGLTAPNAVAIRDAMTAAFRRAGLSPRSIGYFEAHGIAATLGDAIELNAVRDVYLASLPQPDDPVECLVGSAKRVFGHSELASGLLAVCKVLLAFRHRRLSGLGGFEGLNPHIVPGDVPFRFPKTARAWPANPSGESLPMRAAVGSFGFGGVCAHVVLEEAPAESAPHPVPMSASSTHPFIVSAATRKQLTSTLNALAQAIGAKPELAIADIARTLREGRRGRVWRAAFVCREGAELSARFADCAQAVEQAGEPGEGVSVRCVVNGEPAYVGRAARQRAADAVGVSALASDPVADQATLLARWCEGDDTAAHALAAMSSSGSKTSLPAPVLAPRRYWKTPDATTSAPTARHERPLSSAPAATGAASDAEATLRDILAGLLDMPASGFELDRPLADYGLESLLDRHLVAMIVDRTGVRIGLGDLYANRTLRALCALVDGQASSTRPVVDMLLERFRRGELDIDDIVDLV